GTVPDSIARLHSSNPDIIILDLPIQIPPLQLYMQWHGSREADPSIRWLRQVIMQTAHELGYRPK
ncbi:hypothetical protein, partial [Antarctobacter sp.]|uniref:hypothetical protein n=1 Tax=Antarctobacter sp. TaxID=1872577 RepID=UPI003A8F8744